MAGRARRSMAKPIRGQSDSKDRQPRPLPLSGLRVTGGVRRGLKLEAPNDTRIRPTADRVRQAMFNLLSHRGQDGDIVRGAVILDAFAGTGALGIEALSRGAKAATFLDTDQTALSLVSRNVAKAGMVDCTRTVLGDATRPPACTTPPATLLFLDPPYGLDLAAPALLALGRAGWVAANAHAVVEHDHADPVEPPASWDRVVNRRYGRVAIQLWRQTTSSEHQ